MAVDGRLVAFDQLGLDDVAVLDGQHTKSTVLVFHREMAAGVLRDKVNLAGRQIGDVGLFPLAEAVRLLGFLAAEAEPSGEDAAVFEGEVDLDVIGFC